MKKRIISILLSLCLVLPLLPTLSATATTTQKPWDQSPGDWTALTEEYLQTVGYKISGGCYYLDADVTLPKTLVVTGASATDKNVTLDLNGHVLKLDNAIYGGSTTGSVIKVGNSSTAGQLTLKDSDPTTVHKFTPNTDGLWVLDETNGAETVNGGVIIDGYEAPSGGGSGVYITGGSTFTMIGGSIIGCMAQYGGGVCVDPGCTFEMKNGLIAGCTATDGGGVYNEGIFTMNDGSITGNTANDGGGVYCSTYSTYDNGAVFNLCGGSISDNISTDHGGMNVYIGAKRGSNTVTMNANGGTVSDTVYNYGTITTVAGYSGTTFNGSVDNYINGTISGGTFYGTVSNIGDGAEGGTISGGTFNGTVINDGTITGGTFNGTVKDLGGTIDDSARTTVTFDSKGGSAVTEQKVLKGQKATAPNDPTREGRNFVGWYTDSDCNTAFDFSTAITESITLYAKWECAGHTGGKATCTEKAICEVCGKEYGEIDPDNHAGKEIWTKLVREHQKAWDCCDHATVDFEPHEWENGVCKECGYVCLHPTGSDATCKEQSVCLICGEKFDKIDATNHEGKAVWTTTETSHEKVWDCCGEVAVESEVHEWKNGVCFECGYVCLHKGGKSDCSHKAVCTLCGSEYGELGGTHVGKEIWVSDSKTHTKKWDCCGAEIIPETAHEFDENGDCVCGAREFIFGDANGDGKIDSSDVILLKKYIANYDPETGSSSVELCRGADMNGDGKIDSRDIILIKKYIANYTPETKE